MIAKTLSIVVGVVATLFLTAPTTQSESTSLMEKKTKHAQEIFRYLALGDLSKVESEASALEQITIDAGFESESKQYKAYGNEFLNQTQGLKEMAAEKNTAGAYYYFTRMTGVCFSCHEHVRNPDTNSDE